MLFPDMKSFYHNAQSNEAHYYSEIHPKIQGAIDAFREENPTAEPFTIKSRLHTLIAEYFEPVLFLESPFFYEMGVRPPHSWGRFSYPITPFIERQRREVFLDPALDEARKNFDARCAQVGGNRKVHLGLYRTPTPGFDSDHNSLGYSLLFEIGVSGLLSKIQEKMSTLPLQSEAYSYLLSVKESCLALLRIASKFAIAAKEALPLCKDERSRKYMKMISESAARIPAEPPTSFYEGLAMIWFLRECIASLEEIGISVLGQVDLLLGPLYASDLARGRITEEEARELIRLWLLPTDIKFRSDSNPWPETSTCITLGGSDHLGAPLYNDVTRMVIEEHCALHLVAPKLNLRFTKDSPKEYLELVSRKILAGYNNFALSCDDVILPALERCGICAEDARRYVNGGCQETMIEGMGHTAGAYLYVLLPSVLDMSLNPSPISETLSEGARDGIPDVISNAASFEEFYQAVMQNIKKVIGKANEEQIRMGREQKRLNPCPLFSSTHEGCIEAGRDYTDGGAKYNISTICMCGIATLTDSLYAIRELVFEKGLLSLARLSEILNRNWEGEQELRHISLKLPKYGEDNEKVDALAKRLVSDIQSFVTSLPNERGGKTILSMFSYYLFRTFAPYVGASADGRLEGEFLSQGISAARSGKRTTIPSLLSTIKTVAYSELSGISVLDVLLPPDTDAERLCAIIRSAADYGCPNLQLNCLSKQALLDAQREPQLHRNVIVRVSGLSVYFVNLKREIQDEIIQRTFYA